MLKKYIEEHDIVDMTIRSVKNLYDKVEVDAVSNLEKEKKKKRKSSKWKNFTILVIFGIVSLFFLAFAIGSFIFDREHDLGDIAVVCINAFISYVTFSISKNALTRLISKSEPLSRNEIEQCTREKIQFIFSSELSKLGKIFMYNHNKITGNSSENLIGDVYISFKINKLNQYSILLYNEQEYTQGEKNFYLNDIVLCRKKTKGYDKNSYTVDMSDYINATKDAISEQFVSSIERSTRRRGESFSQSLSHSRAIINEGNAKAKLKQDIENMEKKKKDETEYLDLKFKDGSTFLIKFIDDNTLNKLQYLLENQDGSY